MDIEIKCFATLSRFTPAGGRMQIDDGTTVSGVMQSLGIAPDDVKIVFINGIHAAPETPLNPGDRLGLFPAVGGG